MHHVFVYGTLKRGFRLHDYMQGAVYLGPGKLKNYRMHRISWYPAIVEFPGEEVFGELFRCPESLLPVLDEVEDRGTMYERVIREIELLDEEHGAVKRRKLHGHSQIFRSSQHLQSVERFEQSPENETLEAAGHSDILAENAEKAGNREGTITAFVYVYLLPLSNEPVIEGGNFH